MCPAVKQFYDDGLSAKHANCLQRSERFRSQAQKTHLFNGGHLDRFVVVQGRMGRVHVIPKTSHRHLVTVMQRHRYSNGAQSWNVLE